jgi:hypothetical protein
MTLSKRAILVIPTLLALVQIALWGSFALVWWTFKDGLKAELSPESIAANTHFAELLAAAALVNLVAVVIFLLKSRSYGWWCLVGVQVADALGLAVRLIVGNFSDVGIVFILAFGAVAAVGTTALLFVLRFRPGAGRVRATSP